MSDSAHVETWWSPSELRPGFYYVAILVPGFHAPGWYAVVDDFGNLVEVPR